MTQVEPKEHFIEFDLDEKNNITKVHWPFKNMEVNDICKTGGPHEYLKIVRRKVYSYAVSTRKAKKGKPPSNPKKFQCVTAYGILHIWRTA